jgi:hypothetical protein
MDSLASYIPAPISTAVPVVTPNGGDAKRQNDPNGPEAILRSIKTVEVQANTDRKYDIPVNPYATAETKEAFCQPATLRSLLNTPFAPVLVLLLRFFLGAVVANGRRS